MRFLSLPWLRVLLTALLLCGIGSVAVAGGLLGTAEWGLNDYSRTVNGESEVEASSLSQNYAILYGEKGLIMNGRGGLWDVNLGYELITLDTSIDDRDYSLQTAKPLYRGHLLLAPGGLPFRLDVSVEDNQRSSIAEDTDDQLLASELITPHVGTDISNGTRRKTRATLLVGIRNGSYLGQYRDLLSQLPRLLVDYRQEDVDDTKALSPQKYRRRELAFVSLNKKDNWFHFRYSDFNDFITGEQSENKQVLLGTIDHLMTRQWVNLTSWIQVSADGSYSTYVNNLRPYDNYNGYDVNLQAIGRRADYQIFSLNRLDRTVGTKALQRSLNQTVYANGELNRDTAWRFQQVLDQFQSDPAWSKPFGLAPETSTSFRDVSVDQTDFYTAGQMETWRQRKRQLTFKGAIEKLVDKEAEGEALQVGVTLDSSQGLRLSREGSTAYELLLTYLQGQTDQVDDVAYLEMDGIVRYDRAVTNRMAYGASQEVIKGFGDVDDNVTRNISIKGTLSMSYSNTGLSTRQAGVIHSISTAYLEHETLTGWRNRVQATLEIIENHVGNGNQFALAHNLVKAASTLYGSLTNTLVVGEGLDLKGSGSTVTGGGLMGNSDVDLSNVADVAWTPNRNLSAKAKAQHRQRIGNGEPERQLLVSEEIKYHIYTVNGFIRKLADITERLTYETLNSHSGSRTGVEAYLSGFLYPTGISFVGVEFTGKRLEADGSTSMRYVVDLNAGLRFPLMEVLCNYAVGMQPSPDSSSSILALQDERREQRWGLRVKKIF